jgi:hypothetical protein
MRSLGWVLKAAKLLGYPDPLLEMPALGIIVSFSAQQFRLKPAHAQEILELAAHLDTLRACPVKVLSRFAGLIVSLSRCLGPAARMRTRAIYANIEDRLKPHEKLQINNSRGLGWARSVHLRAASKAEIAFWIRNLHRVNGQPFRREDIHRVLDIDIDTDASKRGWGAVLYLPDPTAAPDPILLNAARRALPPGMTLIAIKSALHNGIRICGVFSLEEAAESSNVRELLATSYSFRAFLPFLQGLSLDHYMDNLGAVQALGGLVPSDPDRIYGGSNTPRIQELVISIDDCCIEANVDRRTFWVPRTLNVIADYMSKLGTGDVFSFTVQPWVREMLDSSFGTHTIDRFASYNNVQVSPPRYNSKFFEQHAEWLNAFSCHWTWGPSQQRENNWIHPPYQLAGRALHHLQICQAQGTIILPRWELAPWWPSVAALLPFCTCLTLGQASDVLCFPPDSRYGVADLPRGTILALHFQELAWSH